MSCDSYSFVCRALTAVERSDIARTHRAGVRGDRILEWMARIRGFFATASAESYSPRPSESRIIASVRMAADLAANRGVRVVTLRILLFSLEYLIWRPRDRSGDARQQ